jgi:hypothetical protein
VAGIKMVVKIISLPAFGIAKIVEDVVKIVEIVISILTAVNSIFANKVDDLLKL